MSDETDYMRQIARGQQHQNFLDRMADKLDRLEADRDDWKARADQAETALANLISWFPDEPSKPEWRIKAGADDAVAAARAALKEQGQ